LLDRIKEEKADKVLILGDILYHGPRNDLPKEYAPKAVIEMLNPLKNILLCVRGNCDTEVDQMVLDFPILADYSVIPMGDKLIYATHGHIYNENNRPPLAKGDILLNGHTHIPKCTEYEDFIYMNPGSVSIPKENSFHSYMILENGEFLWKNLENGEIYLSYNV
jgi:putative phosphoesterase